MAPTFLRTMARPTAAGAVTGAALAACLLAVDSFVAEAGGGLVSTGNARALLAAAFGSVVTVGTFSFWVRPLAAQLASSSVPPRLLAGHLYDRFQRRVVGATAGVLAFLALVLLALPSAPDRPAPVVSTTASAVLAVAAVAALLVAMRHAERSTRPSVVLAEAAQGVIDHVRVAALDERVERTHVASMGAPARVVARSSGWVSAVDHDGLLRAVPEGTTLRLEAEPGTFVTAGWTTVVSVWPAEVLDDDVRGHLAAHVHIGSERGMPLDVVGAMTQFVDVGVHAASASTGSPSTVYEAMWWLGAVLHELGRHRDVGFPDRRTDDGRTLIRVWRLSLPSLAELAVGRIRRVTASDPEMALELLRVVLDARMEAQLHDADGVATVLGDQADLIVQQCQCGPGLAHDIDRVVRARREDHPANIAARVDEYPAGELDGPRRRDQRARRDAPVP